MRLKSLLKILCSEIKKIHSIHNKKKLPEPFLIFIPYSKKPYKLIAIAIDSKTHVHLKMSELKMSQNKKKPFKRILLL